MKLHILGAIGLVHLRMIKMMYNEKVIPAHSFCVLCLLLCGCIHHADREHL